MDIKEMYGSKKRHPWELARYEVVKDLVDQHVENYDGMKILDLGCGDLFFLRKFSENKNSTEFYGVDTAFSSIESSSDKDHISKYSSIDDLPSGKDFSFNIIFLMDVIEHIEDDVGFLQDLMGRSFFTEETLLVITVPAYQFLFCSHDVFLGHYRRYTNSTLQFVTDPIGLRCIKKGYFFFTLLFPRLAEVLNEKIKLKKVAETGTRLSSWDRGSGVTQILKEVLVWDYKIQKLLKSRGIQLPGLSNYILCKKHVS